MVSLKEQKRSKHQNFVFSWLKESLIHPHWFQPEIAKLPHGPLKILGIASRLFLAALDKNGRDGGEAAPPGTCGGSSALRFFNFQDLA